MISDDKDSMQGSRGPKTRAPLGDWCGRVVWCEGVPSSLHLLFSEAKKEKCDFMQASVISPVGDCSFDTICITRERLARGL